MLKTQLRSICEADSPLPCFHHAHKCDHCGTCWHHPDALATDPTCSLEEFKAAHDCPSCGEQQREKHWTKETRQQAICDLLNGGRNG